MAKGTTVAQAQPPPPTPAPPSAAQSASDFAAAYPKILQTYIENLPKQLSAQYEAIAKYAPLLSQVQFDIEKNLYPYTAGLQEQVARRAGEGINAPVPDATRQAYLDQLNAGLGYNVASPAAADYRSLGLLNLQESWRRYYTDLALTTTGRLPLTQATGPNVPDLSGGFNPATVYGYNAQNYNTFAGTYANLYGNTPFVVRPGSRGRIASGILGGIGAAIGSQGGPLGASFGYNIGSGLGNQIFQ